MAILQVAQLGNPILHKKAIPVPLETIKSPEIQQLIDDMIETLKEEDGVGLASPQVFANKQIFIMKCNAQRKGRGIRIPLTVIINPKLLSKSTDQELDWEGCLSISGGTIRGIVPRASEIEFEAYDRNGEKFIMKASSFKAKIIQHEWDHLNGILFFERMRAIDLKHLTTIKNWAQFYRTKWNGPRPLSKAKKTDRM